MKNRGRSGVTLADVAREAGVSAMTVSRALRNPDRVSARSRDAIQAVIERLGYVPDPAARALAAGRTNVIGVIVPSVTNNVFADVMRGIYDAAEGTPWQVQLGNSRYSPIAEEDLVRTFLSQKPAGLIISGIDQSEATAGLLRSAPCRIVQIMETGPDPFDMMVGFSHREAAGAATRHLLDAGYRRIGFLGARLDPRTQRRLEGFRVCLSPAGLLDDARIVTTPQPSSVTLGGHLMADLLSTAPDTDAVFCNNDDLAVGALFECQRRRIAVPGQMGICGFNDLEMMAAAHPSITSVLTFRHEMGRQAMSLLGAALRGEETSQPVVDLGFEVVPRATTDRTLQPGRAEGGGVRARAP
ncbi:LacI family DNA-binding transcriptional regulator [Oceaniradius stylonematis]|jgi:LacI family transcriptional regulator, gluconate utilization system Gnt-I transcriptional repressor|uniref:LacI family DNA-binding transcriptional regulator n=1 Tax=Oceaniradius stylonematis TaxID=2184161 RepID=UPI00273D7884|nr:LacI family DNA-binding transcriptional regulator [Oceaniradius stylonematis]